MNSWEKASRIFEAAEASSAKNGQFSKALKSNLSSRAQGLLNMDVVKSLTDLSSKLDSIAGGEKLLPVWMVLVKKLSELGESEGE